MPNLLMVPTQQERLVLEAALRDRGWFPARSCAWTIELCGFGLIAAAACAAEAIARQAPSRMILAGIAGSLDGSLAIGSACLFDCVTCHGIGVGESLSEAHRSVAELGWAHCEADESRPAIGDTILLSWASDAVGGPTVDSGVQRRLLSVTAAAANPSEAERRRNRFPDALAEDMEGFAVALACRRANIPLQIVRGVSNRAGDREHARWQIGPALCSVADIVAHQISESR